MVEGEWAGRVTGLGDQRVEIAMMRMPDGHGRLELSRFIEPSVIEDHRTAPVNALGYLRVMFAVDDIDETLERLRKHGAELVGRSSSTASRSGSATSVARRGCSSGSRRTDAARPPTISLAGPRAVDTPHGWYSTPGRDRDSALRGRCRSRRR